MIADLVSVDPDPDPVAEVGALTWVRVALYSVATLSALIFPFTYAESANAKLRKDLGIAVSNISLSERGLAVTFTMKLASPDRVLLIDRG